jgi:hypothetical protein
MMALAVHEAGHTVAQLALPGTTTPSGTTIQSGGFAGANATALTDAYQAGALLPAHLPATVSELWQLVIAALAGPMAELRYRHRPLTRRALLAEFGGSWDLLDARAMTRYGWPDHTKEALQLAVEATATLIHHPDVWAGIEALASYLVDHGRAEAPTIDVLVRRSLPYPLAQAPGVQWAIANARIDPRRAPAALAAREAEHTRRVTERG